MFETIWRKKKNLKFFESSEGKIAFIENDKGYFCLGGNKGLNEMVEGSLVSGHVVGQEANKKIHNNKKPTCGYYVSEAVSSKISKNYKVFQIGYEYIVDIKKVVWTRPYFNRINNYAKRNNYSFHYYEQVDTEDFKKIKLLEKKSKSHQALPSIGFLLSTAERDFTEWALVKRGEQLVAALGVNKINQESYYTDNIISSKERMAMDFCVWSLLSRAKDKDIKFINLGAVPFQGLKDIKNLFYWGQYFNWLYSSKGLAHFKKTYATSKTPVFCYFDKRKNIVLQLYRLVKLHFS